MGTCIQQGDLFYSVGLHRNHVSARANTEEIGRGFGKNAGEWTRRVEISKEEIPGSKHSMYGYILTYSSFEGRTFKLCVLTRWGFNFCVCSSPLQGPKETEWSALTAITQRKKKEKKKKNGSKIKKQNKSKTPIWEITS